MKRTRSRQFLERLTAWQSRNGMWICQQQFVSIEREISIEDAKRMYGFDAHPDAVSVQVVFEAIRCARVWRLLVLRHTSRGYQISLQVKTEVWGSEVWLKLKGIARASWRTSASRNQGLNHFQGGLRALQQEPERAELECNSGTGMKLRN